MYEFEKIEQIILSVKNGPLSIEDGFYEASKKLDTYHATLMDQYIAKGFSKKDALIILLGRRVGSSYTDPFTMYFCRHAIWSEPEIERMEDVK